MILSVHAKNDLREALQNQIGLDGTKDLSDKELNEVGLLLLTILAENIKMKVANPNLVLK